MKNSEKKRVFYLWESDFPDPGSEPSSSDMCGVSGINQVEHEQSDCASCFQKEC
jgi:hypothetical protein